MFNIVTENVDHVAMVGQVSGVFLVTWSALYLFFFPLSRYLWPQHFNKLTSHQKYEWSARIVSTIHATLAVSAALYTIFLEGELYKEGVEFGKRMSLGIDITASLTLSYWIYDLALIMVYWKGNPDKAMFAHHLCGIIPFAMGTVYGEFMSFAPAIILTEMSTPFVNARWFFFITENTSSAFYAVNGLMMWLSFLVCRIIWLPIGMSNLFLNIPYYLRTYHATVVVPTLIGCPTAYALSCYWFLLITKGLLKVVSGMIRGDKKKQEQEQHKKMKKVE